MPPRKRKKIEEPISDHIPSALDKPFAIGECYGLSRGLCDGQILLTNSVWRPILKRWEGGVWIHRNLPPYVHPAMPRRD